jgi:peptidoglycan/LPS O-acetylase OafA/YrhL
MEFYKKRVLRIIPTVIILLSLFAITKDLLLGRNPTTIIHLGYWFFSVYANYWFIGAILLFYALYPLVFYGIRKNSLLTTIVAFVFSLAGILCIHFLSVGQFDQLVVYFARFPVFILGAVFAHHQRLLTYSKSIIILLLLSIPCLIYFPKDFQRLMYFPLAIAVCVVLPQFLDKMPPFFAKICDFFGKVSLEFYLIHVFLFGMGFIGWLNAEFDIYVCILLAFIAATVCSYLSSLVISSITKRFCR